MKTQRIIITLAWTVLALMGLALTGCGSATATENNPSKTEESAAVSETAGAAEEADGALSPENNEPSEAEPGLQQATAEEVKTLLADPILSWYPGTAGSSLKLAAVATDMLSFASAYDPAENLRTVWKDLPEGEQLRFAENVDALSELILEIKTDYASVSGLFEDAGVAEKLDELLSQENIWGKWDALYWQLKDPLEPGSSSR